MCKGLFCIIETGVGDTASIFGVQSFFFIKNGSPSENSHTTCTPKVEREQMKIPAGKAGLLPFVGADKRCLRYIYFSSSLNRQTPS